MCYPMLRNLRFHVHKEFSVGFGVNISETNNLRRYSVEMDSTEMDSTDKINKDGSSTIPEEPTTCCMSGCANCVWIQYAEEVAKVLQDGKKSKEFVLEKVSDPNMRAFLMTELKTLEMVKENT